MEPQKVTKLNEWVEIVEVPIINSNPYYYINVPDYVFVLGVSADKEIPIVSQYRFAQRRWTLELPAGLIDNRKSALEVAVQEIQEEVGVFNWDSIVQGPTFVSDSGRISNRTHFFIFEGIVKPVQQMGELETYWISSEELVSMTLKGRLDHIGQSALVLWALHQGYI